MGSPETASAGQCPLKTAKPLAKASSLASHLIHVAKAPKKRAFETIIHDSWRQFNCKAASNPMPTPFRSGEVIAAFKQVKTGIVPGYNNTHSEFLKILGPMGCTWLANFFTQVTTESQIPKLWRQAKIIAVEKPG